MPEIKNYTFSHTELAEILIKHLGIKEGQWAVYIEFTMLAANVPAPPDGQVVLPASINFVQKIGIQRFSATTNTPTSLIVDAAAVASPPGAASAPGKKRHRG